MLVALAGAAAAATSALPLESVSFTVDVVGPLAEIVVRQRFRNEQEATTDARYLFPLDDGAVVDGLVMTVGDRVIRSEIVEREEARRVWEEAAAEGRVAGLLEQQRPNVFTQDVANLPPGVPVEVELRLVQPVDRVDGEWELVLPLVVAPRFVPTDTPDADPLAAEGPSGVHADLDVVVHAGVPIGGVTSPTHPIEPLLDDDDANVILEDVPLTSDFVLRWRTAGDEPATGLLVAGHHAMLVIEPPVAMPFEERVPRELVWVLDTSCSMRGAPIALAKDAMAEALATMDPRDSFVILGFANEVATFRARPVPATPEHLADGLEYVRRLDANGGTWIMKAVHAALAMPEDPSRRRTVVLLTDGLVANDPEVLRAVADHADRATFVSLGIGSAPNRWLLDELAQLGGGVVAYAPLQGDAAGSMAILVEAMDRPVWTGLAIDWGDCGAHGLAPARPPDLRSGRPVRILAKLDGDCTSDVYVTARTGGGTTSFPVPPQHVPHDRAMASTWARERVADLERGFLRGDSRDVGDEVLAIGLSAGIVTSQTSFVAVDDRVVDPSGPPDLPLEAADGDEVEEIMVLSVRPAVDTGSTVHGTVLTKDYLNKVPAGRDYQRAVALAPATVLLDGVNVTDPGTGTFSMNFSLDAIQEVEVIDRGRMPELPGGDAVVNVVTRTGSNHLELDLGLTGNVAGPGPLSAGGGTGSVSGPLARDKVWITAHAAADGTGLGGIESREARASGAVTLQPTPEHRFTFAGAADPSTLAWDERTAAYGGGLGAARWQVFPSPQVNTDLRALWTRRTVGDVDRDRIEVSAVGRALAVDDPLGGTHDLAAGIGWSRLAWATPGDALATDLPTLFVQDSFEPVDALTLAGGLRLEVLLPSLRPLPSPRLFVAWDPFGDARTKIGGGYARYVDVSRILPEGFPDPPITDEGHLVLEREVQGDLALVGGAALGRDRFAFVASPELVPLPVGPAPTVDRTTTALDVGLRKPDSRRWAAEATWTWRPPILADRDLLADPRAPFVPGFLDAYREHVVSASAYWDLPTDPWTQSIGASVRHATAIRADGPWWLAPATTAGASLAQALDVRKGALTVRATLSFALNDAGATLLPVEALALVPGAPAPDEQPPLRFEGGLTYGF